MIKRIRTINEVLPELMLSEVIFAVLCELIGIWFVKRKLYYSLGLLIGLILAEFMICQMAISIDKASYYKEEKGAGNQLRMGMILRYTVIAITLGVLCMTDFANPLSAFLGVMGVKVAAYTQPTLHKLIDKIVKRR